MITNSKPIISIIVPVYNTSIYLEQCLNSIYNQTFKDYEVICIDDGSEDNSLDILKKYEKIFENYKIICSENKGVACARNTGLDNAKGDYIIFIDSDDFIKEDYLDKLYNESCKTNADIVMCNFYKYYEKYNISIPVIFKKGTGLYNSGDLLSSLICDTLIHSYLWNKLFKRHIFDNLRFPIMKYEDLAIMCKIFHNANKISIIKDSLYYYRIRKNSIVRNYSINTQNDYIRAYGLIRLFLEENNLYKKHKISYHLLSIRAFFVMIYINMCLINYYKDFKITLENFKSCYNFILNTDSDEFSLSKDDLFDLHVLNPVTINKSTEC